MRKMPYNLYCVFGLMLGWARVGAGVRDGARARKISCCGLIVNFTTHIIVRLGTRILSVVYHYL